MNYKYIQEIIARAADSSRHTVYIEHADDTSLYELQMIYREPSGDAWVVEVVSQHSTAEASLDEAAKALATYASKHRTHFVSVDSPCNARFIKVDAQAQTLSRHGIKVHPTENGK